MKTIFIVALLFLTISCWGQEGTLTDYNEDYNISFGNFTFDYEPVITDSIVWNTIEVALAGDSLCVHDWVYSKRWRTNSNISCLVMHYGFHCSWNDAHRGLICRKCHRKEIQKETWYQHRKKHIPTDYELLEAKIEEKK